MPLVEFVCNKCTESSYTFDDDLVSGKPTDKCQCGQADWWRMPPLVTIIHRTEIFMLTQLDTVHTIHDLDAELQREAADDREVKQQNAARKEL